MMMDFCHIEDTDNIANFLKKGRAHGKRRKAY